MLLFYFKIREAEYSAYV